MLVPGDDGWPDGVDRLAHPPYCLYVRGDADLAALTERSVAVVGSRAASEYGLRVAGDLADGLVARGWTVVSGAAYGIDAAAHRAALAADGPTVAVLACGADRAYPATHRGLLDAVARTGAVVSEVPPGCAPYRSRFLARNRLIAALARATVVVEASLRSGSLTTAREARLLHLPVGAVPGPVTSMASAGCHALVRETDAVLVTDAGEVAELAGHIGEDLRPGARAAARAPGGRPRHHVVRRLVGSARCGAGSAPTGSCRRPGCLRAGSSGILAGLEADGLVTRHDGRWRKVAASRRDEGLLGELGTQGPGPPAPTPRPEPGPRGERRAPEADRRPAVEGGDPGSPAQDLRRHRGAGRRVSVV